LADRAKSFSTLGVRRIRRFRRLNDPLLGDKGAVSAAWAAGELELGDDEGTARDKVIDEDLVHDCEAIGDEM